MENGVSQQKNKSKKTAEEIEEKFQAGLQKIQTKCDLLATVNPRDLEKEGEPYTHDFRQCVLVFANSYFYFKTGEVAFSEIIRYRTCVSEYLCQSHVLGTILKTLADGLKRRDYFDEAGEVLKDYWFPTKNMLNTLLNNSDLIDSIKFSITEHTEMIPQLMAVLENYREPHMNKTLTVSCLNLFFYICFLFVDGVQTLDTVFIFQPCVVNNCLHLNIHSILSAVFCLC